MNAKSASSKNPMEARKRPANGCSNQAPELLLGELNTVASDVYAFGIVMFEMLVHRQPWQDTKMLDIHDYVHKGDRPSFSEVDVAPGAPSAWVPLMREAWSQEPDRRPEFSLLQQRFSNFLCSTPEEGRRGATRRESAGSPETGTELGVVHLDTYVRLDDDDQ